MDKEIFVKKMQVSRILFKYNVPINEAKIIGTFIEELEQQCKKQREVIDKAIELLNNPWSFESGNKEVDEITYNKKRKVIDILNEVSEWIIEKK